MAMHKDTPGDRQLAEFCGLSVERFMERDVQVGHRHTKADVLASQMIEGFGAVPIVDEDRRLVGIVSEYDLLGALLRGHRWSDLAAEEIMSPNPYAVRPETNVGTLVRVLRDSQLIRVPVVDKHDRLVGIVARRDILFGYLNCGLAPGV